MMSNGASCKLIWYLLRCLGLSVATRNVDVTELLVLETNGGAGVTGISIPHVAKHSNAGKVTASISVPKIWFEYASNGKRSVVYSGILQ